MILRNFVRLCVFGGCFVFLGIVHASGLTNLSDTQIQTMIQQDQTQYYELMEKAQREQQLGNQASVERVRTEVETINQRLQAYSEELRRRGVVPGGSFTETTTTQRRVQEPGNTYGGQPRQQPSNGDVRTTRTETSHSQGFEDVRPVQEWHGSDPDQRWVQTNSGGQQWIQTNPGGQQWVGGDTANTRQQWVGGDNANTRQEWTNETERQEFDDSNRQKYEWKGDELKDDGGAKFEWDDEKWKDFAPDTKWEDQKKRLEDEGDADPFEWNEGPAPVEDDNNGEGRKAKGLAAKGQVEGVQTDFDEKPEECEGTVFCGIGLERGADLTGDKLSAVNNGEGAGITTNTDLKLLVIGWVRFGLTFVTILAVIALVWAGVMMIAHFGDEAQIEKSKKIIIWCSAGLVLIFLSFAIVNVISRAADPEDTNKAKAPSTPVGIGYVLLGVEPRLSEEMRPDSKIVLLWDFKSSISIFRS